MKNEFSSQIVKKYKLTAEQIQVYTWLKHQELNTDDNTLCFWFKKYVGNRIVDVVRFAQDRCKNGQSIRNIGGWINKLLITGLPVSNDECKANRDFVQRYIKVNNWHDLTIYEKYIVDKITGEDLSLTMSQQEFLRALEALHNKSVIYKRLQ